MPGDSATGSIVFGAVPVTECRADETRTRVWLVSANPGLLSAPSHGTLGGLDAVSACPVHIQCSRLLAMTSQTVASPERLVWDSAKGSSTTCVVRNCLVLEPVPEF